jgi:bis(5'-nucleosyl)-tetraphosphatase (symmetrical)
MAYHAYCAQRLPDAYMIEQAMRYDSCFLASALPFMPTYAIGDLQGCCEEFESLLEMISFDRAHDTLWLVGDLVNRGPESLRTLRVVKALGDAAIAVLGNHDFHLLAAYCGVRKRGRNDTLDEILNAPDASALIDWLRTRPLAHEGTFSGIRHLMVHAGLVPQWSIDQALQFASELSNAISGEHWRATLTTLFGNTPPRWSDDLQGDQRLRCIVNILTRLRFCSADGDLDFTTNQSSASAPDGLLPWFELRDQSGRDGVIVTGHWSALGLHVSGAHIGTDTGCVWGGALTAVRLEDRAVFQQPCPLYQQANKAG